MPLLVVMMSIGLFFNNFFFLNKMKTKAHYLYFFVIAVLLVSFTYLSFPNKNQNPTPTEEEVSLEEITTEAVVDETTECILNDYDDKYFTIMLYIFSVTLFMCCVITFVSKSLDNWVNKIYPFLLMVVFCIGIISFFLDSLKINQIIISSIIVLFCILIFCKYIFKQ